MSKFIRSYETLMAGRFVAGLFCGLFSGLVPMYLNELAPINLKGLAGTMNQLFIVNNFSNWIQIKIFIFNQNRSVV